MKIQFDHNLQSSFYLWFDDKITRELEGTIDPPSGGQVFDVVVRGNSAQAIDIPDNLDAYYCASRQLVANDNQEPIIEIDGVPYSQKDPIINYMLDYNDGRILVPGVSSGGANLVNKEITGFFKTKELNVYITNETEEQLFLQNDFILSDVAGQPTYLQQQAEIGDLKYSLPAAFISLNSSFNKEWAIGGVNDTRSLIRVVVIADGNYNLDAVLSAFRDYQKKQFHIINFEDFPFGEFFHVKSPPYYYPDYIDLYKTDQGPAFIDHITVSKLFDRSGAQIPKGIRVGFIDFEISTIR